MLGPNTKDCYPSKKRHRHVKREYHVTKKVEVGVMHLQVKEHQHVSNTTRTRKKVWGIQKEHGMISDF